MRGRGLIVPFVVLGISLVGTSAQAAPNADSTCVTLRLAVPTRAADGSWAGTILAVPRFCYDGTNVTNFQPTTNGRAAPGWTFRGVIHTRYSGAIGSRSRGVWEKAQFCRGNTQVQCLESHESVFPRVWLVAHGDGTYRLGRGVDPDPAS